MKNQSEINYSNKVGIAQIIWPFKQGFPRGKDDRRRFKPGSEVLIDNVYKKFGIFEISDDGKVDADSEYQPSLRPNQGREEPKAKATPTR